MKTFIKGSFLLMAVILFIKFIVVSSIACGVAWIIGLAFNITINYFIPIGIVAVIYLLASIVFIAQGLLFKKVANEIDKEFDTDFFR